MTSRRQAQLLTERAQLKASLHTIARKTGDHEAALEQLEKRRDRVDVRIRQIDAMLIGSQNAAVLALSKPASRKHPVANEPSTLERVELAVARFPGKFNSHGLAGVAEITQSEAASLMVALLKRGILREVGDRGYFEYVAPLLSEAV